MNSRIAFLSLLALSLLLGGCADAGKDAQTRIQGLARPGWARMVNLTDDQVTLKHDHEVRGIMLRDQASELKPVKAGKGKLSYLRAKPVKEGGKLVFKPYGEPVILDVPNETNVGTTIVLYGDGKIAYLQGEPRKPEGSNNGRVLFVDESMKPIESGVSQSVTGPDGPMTFKAEEKLVSLAIGEWRGTKSLSKVEPDYAYTMLFVKRGSGWDSFLLVNSPTDKPNVGNASAG